MGIPLMSKMMKRMLLSTPSPDPLSGEDIRPFAKGELSMGRMPLLFAAQPLSGQNVFEKYVLHTLWRMYLIFKGAPAISCPAGTPYKFGILHYHILKTAAYPYFKLLKFGAL